MEGKEKTGTGRQEKRDESLQYAGRVRADCTQDESPQVAHLLFIVISFFPAVSLSKFQLLAYSRSRTSAWENLETNGSQIV